jgi:hypothetical protein
MTRKFTVPIELPEMAATPATPASGSGALYGKTDGIPYWLGDDGVERPLVTPPPAALHENPGFEGTWFTSSNGNAVVVGTCPPGYSLYWCSNGVTSAQETVDKTEGAYAFRLNKPAGTGINARLHSLTVFAVNPGDTITVSVDAKCDVGAKFYCGWVAASTQAGCDFFSGDPALASGATLFTMTAGAAYRRCSTTFTVPAGCFWFRVTFHFDTTGDVAGVLRLDNSGSTRTVSTGGVLDSVHTRRQASGTQSIANGVTTLMTFATQTELVGGITYAAGTFTVPVAGRYYCSFGVPWTETAAGRRTVVIGKNGLNSVATQDLIPHSSINHTNDLSTTVDLAAGDTIGFYLYQNSGAALLTTGNVDRSFAAITLVGGSKGDPGPVGPPGPADMPMGTTIGARVSGSSTDMGTGVTTPLVFSTTDYNNGCTVTLNDIGTPYGPALAATSIIVPQNGMYQITAEFTPDIQATTGRRVASVYSQPAAGTPNNLILRQEFTQSVAAAYPAMVIAGEVYLTAGSKIETTFYHNSGVGPGTIMSGNPSFLTVRRTDAGVKGDPGPVGPASSVVVPQRQVFTASGTWTKPAGFVYAEVEVQGGGGGGSGAANASASLANAGGSGGGGGFTRKLWLNAQLSATENVVVGTGGTGGPASDAGGGPGNPSSFKTTQIGNGGGGGAASGASSLARGAGGAGGGGSGGDYTVAGGDGPSGAVLPNAGGTAPSTQAITGGTSFFSGAARAGTSAASGNGPTGQVYGGGGVGGHTRANSGAVTGGAGATGIVIVTSYCTT